MQSKSSAGGIVFLTVLATACGVAEGPIYENYAQPPGVIAHALLGKDGGRLQTSDGSLLLEVPPGALPKVVDLTISDVSDPSSATSGAVYEVGPANANLLAPVHLSLTYAPGVGSSEEAADSLPVLATLEDDHWLPVQLNAFNRSAGRVTGSPSHLGQFSLIQLANLQRSCGVDAEALAGCCGLADGEHGQQDHAPKNAAPSLSCAWPKSDACSAKSTNNRQFWEFWSCKTQAAGGAEACSDCLVDCCKSAPADDACPSSSGVITVDLADPPVCQCSRETWLECAEQCAADGKGVEARVCPASEDESHAGGSGGH